MRPLDESNPTGKTEQVSLRPFERVLKKRFKIDTNSFFWRQGAKLLSSYEDWRKRNMWLLVGLELSAFWDLVQYLAITTNNRILSLSYLRSWQLTVLLASTTSAAPSSSARRSSCRRRRRDAECDAARPKPPVDVACCCRRWPGFEYSLCGRIHLSRKMHYSENSMYNTPNAERRIFRSIVHRIRT